MTDSIMNYSLKYDESFELFKSMYPNAKIPKKSKHKKNGLNVIDLFSGCGGISEGFRLAGYNVILGLDYNKDASLTYKLNFPNAISLNANIYDLNSKDKFFNNVDVIVGGPPCQGFSTLNRHNKNLEDDPRNKLFLEFLRFVKDIQPRAVLIENVRGILTSKDGYAKNEIIRMLDELGYFSSFKVLNAKDFGVPQSRKRAFFVGIQKKYNKFSFDSLEKYMKNEVTVGEALEDLFEIEKKIHIDREWELYNYSKSTASNDYQQYLWNNDKLLFNHRINYPNIDVQNRISHVKEGENWKVIPEKLFPYRRENRHSNYMKRLDTKKPSITIDTGHAVYFHPLFHRVPTARESARIQSFNDSFIFLGKKGSQLRQVGNAVPPLLAKAIALALKDVISYG